jgi:hypothetical protein
MGESLNFLTLRRKRRICLNAGGAIALSCGYGHETVLMQPLLGPEQVFESSKFNLELIRSDSERLFAICYRLVEASAKSLEFVDGAGVVAISKFKRKLREDPQDLLFVRFLLGRE